jgi:Bacterial SH3 domain
MKYYFLLAFLFVVLTAPTYAQSVCRVNDPTPTPLNVRSSPNGSVVGTLENGMLVTVLDRTADRRGQTWVY